MMVLKRFSGLFKDLLTLNQLRTCHPAPHGLGEELVPVLHVEILQAVFLEGGGEELRLLGDQVLVGVEVLGDAGEEAPRGGAGRQVVGLDRKLDVQNLGVGAQDVPRHMDLDEHQFLIYDLQTTKNPHLVLI